MRQPNSSLIASRYLVIRSLDRAADMPKGSVRRDTKLLVQDTVTDAQRVLYFVPSGDATVEVLRQFHSSALAKESAFLELPLEWGRSAEGAFYVVPYEEQLSLQDVDGLPFQALLPGLRKALKALSFLHQNGLVHAGLSAESFGMQASDSGSFRLRDLRSCRLMGSTPSDEDLRFVPEPSPPEARSKNEKLDRRTDLFALAVIIRKHAKSIPKKYEPLFRRLCAENKSERPHDAEEVLESLGVNDFSPAQALPPRPASGKKQLDSFERLLNDTVTGTAGPRAVVLRGSFPQVSSSLLNEMEWKAAQVAPDTTRRLVPSHETLVAALRRNTFAPREISVPGDDETLTALLEARHHVEHDQRAQVLFVGSVDALSLRQKQQVEILLRTTDSEDHLLTIVSSRTPLDTGDGAVVEWELDSAAQSSHLDGESSPPSPSTTPPDDEASQFFLGTLAALEGTATAPALPDIPATSLQSLHDGEWITRSGNTFRLLHPSTAETLLSQISPLARQKSHHQAATWYARLALTPRGGAESVSVLQTRRVNHLLLAEAPEAESEFLRHGDLEEAEQWEGAARRVLRDGGHFESRLLAAKILAEAGDPTTALEALAKTATSTKTRAKQQRLALAKARCHLNRREGQLALLATTEHDEDLPETCELTARALVLEGKYAEAIETAQSGLRKNPPSDIAARLHDTSGVAESYLGHPEEARRHLSESLRKHVGARSRARSASYRALVDYRAGNIEEAAQGYLEGYRLAAECGATDLIFYSIQNAATTSHQRGDFGRALSAYRQALDMARALDHAIAAVSIRVNLARLYADLGLFERAQAAAERVLESLSESNPIAKGSAHEVLGDVARLRQLPKVALGHYRKAKQAYEQQSLSRELAEIQLLEASCLAELGERKKASKLIENVSVLPSSVEAKDLRLRLLLAEGALLANAGDAKGSQARLQEAVQLTPSLGLRALKGECETRLYEVAFATDSPWLRETYRRKATETWDRIAATLPDHILDSYWAHPIRAELFEANRSESARSEHLDQILHLNEKLADGCEFRDFIASALEGALLLSAAERGVILRRNSGEISIFEGHADPEFCLEVARQVVESGESVLVSDVAEDLRYLGGAGQGSSLRSLLAVPIKGRERIEGVLYLDHRFRSGVFGASDRELAQGIASQIALALHQNQLEELLQAKTNELKTLATVRTPTTSVQESGAPRERKDTAELAGGLLVGRSAVMQKVISTLIRVASSPVPVLLQGESGTGKELLARMLHERSRPEGPLVSINCGALPEALLEAELFGVKRGAFTGANEDRMGLLESASGGTVFLDELGEMPASMQVKLLRALQEREITPVGSREVRRIDIRLVCATNRNLKNEVASGNFREDLYYRVGVVELDVPPLRERLDDVPSLSAHLLERIAKRTGIEKKLSPAALRKLLEHDFPGNVRELENILTKAALLSEGSSIAPRDFLLERRKESEGAQDRDEFQKREATEMLTMLRSCRWNVSQAARSLNIPRASFYRKMQKYGIGNDGSPN